MAQEVLGRVACTHSRGALGHETFQNPIWVIRYMLEEHGWHMSLVGYGSLFMKATWIWLRNDWPPSPPPSPPTDAPSRTAASFLTRYRIPLVCISLLCLDARMAAKPDISLTQPTTSTELPSFPMMDHFYIHKVFMRYARNSSNIALNQVDMFSQLSKSRNSWADKNNKTLA